MKTVKGFGLAVAVMLAAAIAQAQSTNYVGFPTATETDGKFLGVAGKNFQTFVNQPVRVWISVPPGRTSFRVGFFDGDTGHNALGTNGYLDGHWDYAEDYTPVSFNLYADPLKIADKSVLLATFSGEDMPDNDWYDVDVTVTDDAKALNNFHYYFLEVEFTDPDTADLNSFKIRTDTVATLVPGMWNLLAPLFTFYDVYTIYPNFPDLSGCRYDGQWDFHFFVPTDQPRIEIWDGDFDFGDTALPDKPAATFDTDDPDTPNDIPDFAIDSSAIAEGAQGEGNPPDDYVQRPIFMVPPSVWYSITAPGNVVYPNYDPSGNSEWERFRITTNASEPADFVATNLPAGMYQMHIEGLDLSNLSFLKSDYEIGSTNGNPHLILVKTVSPETVTPGTPVTYSYRVTNDGNEPLENIVVTDDNGTPDYPDDDFIVGTIPALAPGDSVTLTAGVIPVMTMVTSISTNTINAGAMIIVTSLPGGNIKVTYLQDFGVNDNTYGTGSIGWPGEKGHTFGNLTGSDKLDFRFTDKTGKVVLEFYLDTISAAAGVTIPGTGQTITYPSGYGTLGPFGGDGFMVVGDKSNIVTFSTSISENLNNPLNLPFKAGLIVNSPTSLLNPSAPPSDTNVAVNLALAPGGWDYINSYTVVIKGSTFGQAGFGSVSVPDQHNSPSKLGVNQIVTSNSNSYVTNIAVAATVFNGGAVVSRSSAVVHLEIAPPQPPEPLPSPWQTRDIGTVKVPGSASWAANTFTVKGSGYDIGGSADAFRYVYQQATGDCAIVVRVASLQNTDNNAKAGVMIRDNLNANSPEASVCVTPGSGIIFSYRTTAGGSTAKISKTGLKAPYWVRLVRTGNSFTASCSPNGTSWTTIGTKTIAMGSAPSIGMAVASKKRDILCTATFDNVTVTP